MNNDNYIKGTTFNNVHRTYEFDRKLRTLLFSVIEEIELIDKETSEFEFFMMGLRKLIGINSCDYKKIFSKEIPATVKNQFVKWQKKGFAKITNQGENEIFSLTQEGILFLNKFIEELEL